MSGPDFLGRMAAASRERLAQAKGQVPVAELQSRVRAMQAAPRLVRDVSGFDVIAEIKMRSPAEGRLGRSKGDGPEALERLLGRAAAYQRAGAAAISVLTEPSEFQGSLEHLASVAAGVDVPVMRKDFLVDPYQVLEARAHGAGGVLLIVRMLENGRLADMVSEARALGMFALVEAFDRADLDRAALVLDDAVDLPLVLVGLNCRDLATLEVVPERFADLHDAFPKGVAAVAESGLHTPDDVARVAQLGYDMALVGSALMRATDPADLLARMLQSGRSARERTRGGKTAGTGESGSAAEDACASA